VLAADLESVFDLLVSAALPHPQTRTAATVQHTRLFIRRCMLIFSPHVTKNKKRFTNELVRPDLAGIAATRMGGPIRNMYSSLILPNSRNP
jgi:hypothetical protein